MSKWQSFSEWLLHHLAAPDQFLTYVWFYLTVVAVFSATIALTLRIPETRMQRGSLALCLSFSMVMIRQLFAVFLGYTGLLPQPYALLFWGAQSFLTGYFVYALFMEWILPSWGRIWLRTRRFFMKRHRVILLTLALIAGMIGSLLVTLTSAQVKEDPCEGLVTSAQIGVVYETHCILVEPEKGSPQGVFVRRVEDLDGVTLEGIIIYQTADGWEIVDEEFVSPITADLSTAAVGDGWHMELDPTQAAEG